MNKEELIQELKNLKGGQWTEKSADAIAAVLDKYIDNQGSLSYKDRLMNKLEAVESEYKRRMHDAQAKEDYIFASGLCGATARIIKIVKDDKEQTEWDGTEIASPIDCDVCG